MLPRSLSQGYEFVARTNELVWKGTRYECAAGGRDLETDLRIDHGPITSVEPRVEAMGYVYVQVFFANKTYTGAQIRSSHDVKKSFELIVNYIRSYNQNIVPLLFDLSFNNSSYDNFCVTEFEHLEELNSFPGARKMGLPFKEAVERFIEWKYSGRLGRDLTKADIWREDKKLYEAMKAYKRLFKKWPYDIPSQRDLVQQSLEKLYDQGVASLDGRERTALSRKFVRDQRKLAAPSP